MDGKFYIEATITVEKEGICLFETDCEILVDYVDDRGDLDLDVRSFHFTKTSPDGKRTLTAVHPHEPLFHSLLTGVNMDWLTQQVFDLIAENDLNERSLLDA